jgi:transposase
MIRMQGWVDIVAAYHRGVSIKEIVRTTGLSRNTVRKARRSENAPQYERPPVESKLDPYKDYLLERLDEYPRISVEKLYAEISTMGYTGKKTILADFTRPYRKARRRTSDIRFETALGHQAQVDWAELGCYVLDGKRTRVSIFVMVLGYSRMIYAEVVTDETSATFLACHGHAFSFFGGITEEILYDNAKVVALKHDREGIVFNASLLDFAGRYGYTPRVCKSYHLQPRARSRGLCAISGIPSWKVRPSMVLRRCRTDLSPGQITLPTDGYMRPRMRGPVTCCYMRDSGMPVHTRRRNLNR